jgi:hypothetical protein
MQNEGDELLAFLERLEGTVARMIRGIWTFIWTRIPELLRQFFDWLQLQLFYACRVAVRLSRVAGLFVAWTVLVLGPVYIFPGLLTVAWLLLALAGSVWGGQREIKKHRNQTSTKETSHARA